MIDGDARTVRIRVEEREREREIRNVKEGRYTYDRGPGVKGYSYLRVISRPVFSFFFFPSLFMRVI